MLKQRELVRCAVDTHLPPCTRAPPAAHARVRPLARRFPLLPALTPPPMVRRCSVSACASRAMGRTPVLLPWRHEASSRRAAPPARAARCRHGPTGSCRAGCRASIERGDGGHPRLAWAVPTRAPSLDSGARLGGGWRWSRAWAVCRLESSLASLGTMRRVDPQKARFACTLCCHLAERHCGREPLGSPSVSCVGLLLRGGPVRCLY